MTTSPSTTRPSEGRPTEPAVTLQTFRIHDVDLSVADSSQSCAPEIIAGELMADTYRVRRIPFRPGDIVVDIGAHVGMFAILLAKMYPDIRILAYEPYPPNFACLQSNIERNHIRNVTCHPLAVTHDRRTLRMAASVRNTGGASAHAQSLADGVCLDIASVTLQDIFDAHEIENCRLLKVDCEGTEHEILLDTSVLSRVDFVSCETHVNRHLLEQGYSFQRLHAHCEHQLAPGRLVMKPCRMSE
jgi:FkbM family methyltransferase